MGSSWKRPDRSGVAPIMSPAPTTYVSAFSEPSRFRCVAKYSAPPAGTVIACGAPVVGFGTQQPVWIVPGVFASR